MKASRRRAGLTAAMVLLVACGGRERPDPGKPAPTPATAPADSIKILSATPAVDTALRVGDTVAFRVEVEYVLRTAESATVVLVIQRAERGQEPLAGESRVVQKGSGTLVMATEAKVPETSGIRLFTPLNPQGAKATTVVDMRTYTVAAGK